jgi:hypothetical protein
VSGTPVPFVAVLSELFWGAGSLVAAMCISGTPSWRDRRPHGSAAMSFRCLLLRLGKAVLRVRAGQVQAVSLFENLNICLGLRTRRACLET